jgi:hypothetical protein
MGQVHCIAEAFVRSLRIACRGINSVHPTPLMPRWATALQLVIPTEADPDFLHHDTTQDHVWAFHKESRKKFANATNLVRKFGVA